MWVLFCVRVLLVGDVLFSCVNVSRWLLLLMMVIDMV